MELIGKELGFEIHYEKKIDESRDIKAAHIFKAMKPFFLAISLVLYEVSSTKNDITLEEIKQKGLRKIKLMIHREYKELEENL